MSFPRKGIPAESLKKLPANSRPPNTAKKHGGEGAGKTLRAKASTKKRVEFGGKPPSYSAKGFDRLRTKTASPA